MKKHRCTECGGKLGLGVRFRNLWDGFSWIHLRYCSASCEAKDQLTRRNARDRWFSFVPETNTPSVDQGVRR
jgi:hypothetical protein